MTTEKLRCPSSATTARSAIAFASWLPALVWMAVIYLFSDQPYSGDVTAYFFGSFNTLIRKAAHLSEYAILLCLFCYALTTSFQARKESIFFSSKGYSGKIFSIAFSLSFLYALVDEWHQSFVAGRSACLNDVLVDSVGALFGWLACMLACKNHRQ